MWIILPETKCLKALSFARGKLPAVLRQLQMDLRKLMLPYTALKLKEKKRNSLKDFLNVAGPMVKDYTLAVDVARSQLRPRCPADLFKNPPLIVLSGFGTGEQHLKLATIMFQNIFPAIDINTVKLSSCQRIVLLNYNKETKLIDFRHYSIRLEPVGVTRRIKKFVQNHQVPDLRNLQDVSDLLQRLIPPFPNFRAGYGSESEGDDEAATVTLSNDLNRVNRASTKSAVKLQELGPRMTLQLIKIEEGLCTGGVIFSEYDGVKKSPEHKEDGKTSNDDGTNGEGQKSILMMRTVMLMARIMRT
ncbi:unnamed protein product [Rhodiola kirilowii]